MKHAARKGHFALPITQNTSLLLRSAVNDHPQTRWGGVFGSTGQKHCTCHDGAWKRVSGSEDFGRPQRY